MHTSSSLTLFFRYYFPLIIVGFFSISFILSDTSSTEIIILFSFFLCLAPIYFLTLGQLRYVTATYNKLVIETLNYEEEISYNQINYIYQTVLTNPVLIRISYTESETGKVRKFYTLGSLSERMFRFDPFNIKETELTKYIRRQIQAHQPNYDENQEPSRWTQALILFPVWVLTFIMFSIISSLISS